ncbi:histidine kinase [Rossellomorea sp. AcN35-11]|nr:histidine kinase [Rossellomorea aquimaris]WJV30077.1 histidine kinase [Rossellomorea sp. AcN35-11]
MKRIIMMIPIMFIVAVVANWMLEKGYSEIPSDAKTLIIIGAALLSGAVSFFLFKDERGNE